MIHVARILLNLLIVAGASMMDQSGYGAVFALVVLVRYEIGPLSQKYEQ